MDPVTQIPTEAEQFAIQSAPAPSVPDKGEVLTEFNARFKASKEHFADWREEARSLYDMLAGRQWEPDDAEQLREQGRPSVTFNLMQKYLDAIGGLQVNNRQQIRYYPRESGDVAVNELLTGAVEWGRDLSDMADDESDAFGDCVLTGYGWMEGYLDRDLDPAGVPAGSRVDPLEMFPDPTARKRNLADARYLIRVKFVGKDEFEDLVGPQGEDNPDLAEMSAEEDDILRVIQEPRDYRHDASQHEGTKGRKPVADYQWWQREKAYLVQVDGFGETTMDATEWRYYEALLKRAKRPYTAQSFNRRVYYRATIAAGLVVDVARSAYQEGFTYHSITGKRDRNTNTFVGIGRSMVDPQKWTNKFFSTILYSMMVNAKGGLMAEEDAFTDPRKAESEWANPASITWLRKGAMAAGKIQEKAPARYPEGLDRLMQFTMNAIPQISGINAELLGLADRVQPGVVEAQRKQAAMAVIAWAFDAMRRYYRSMGRQLAEYVRLYMADGTLIRITGDSGKQYVPLMRDKMTGNYDVIVDEAPTSVNQRERTWAVLESLIPQLLQAQIPVPKEVIEYAPIPNDLIEAWKKTMQPDPQKAQMADQAQKATLEKLMAEVQKLTAGAQLDQAKAQEIMAELGKPGTDPKAEMQMELLKAQVDAQVQAKIAEFKSNREAETKLLIEQMKIESAERIAAMEAQITTTLERNRMESEDRIERDKMERDASTKLTVAALAKGRTVEEQQDIERDDDEKESAVALVAEAIGELKEAIAQMNAPKPEPAPKPRKFRLKRDKNGDLSEIEEG